MPFKKLGAGYEEIQALIDDAPENVLVTGVIELEEVKKYFWASDIFFLPSNQENHPLAVIEAAACELPIVLRDIKEYDASFGQLAMRGNDGNFTQLIDKLATDKQYYHLAQQGAREIAKRFDNVAGGQRLASCYQAVLTQLNK